MLRKNRDEFHYEYKTNNTKKFCTYINLININY